jgi:hypothetical protein
MAAIGHRFSGCNPRNDRKDSPIFPAGLVDLAKQSPVKVDLDFIRSDVRASHHTLIGVLILTGVNR